MLRRGSIRTLPVLATVFVKTEDRKRTFDKQNLPATTRKEVDPYRNLSVKIIEAKNIPKKDLFSQSDCYVALRLPTASSKTHRTRTVWDSSSPVWNETFHYRIHSHVKNVLELSVLDQDLLSRDDLCINVFYDLDNLSPGEVVRHVFTLNPETKEELHVEFTVEESKEPPGEIQTNGVLVASHLSLLEVQVENSTEAKALAREDEGLALQVTGAYEKEQTVFGLPPYPAPMQPLTFHLNLDLEAEISARLTSDSKSEDPAEEEEAGHTPDTASVTLTSLPVGQEVLLSVPVRKDKDIELKLKAADSAEKLDLRLGFDLSEMELQCVERRKLRVCQALQRVLHLSQAPHPEEVPVVAVVGSGGGVRAMTSLLGSLLGLQRLDLLDTVTYIAGVSGSTWAMSSLYTDPDWSHHDLQGPIGRAQAAVSKSQLGVLSAEQLRYYYGELKKRAGEGQAVSFLDLWGLIIEYLIHGERDPATLSDQQRAVAEGQNPFPIYTAVNLKEGIAGSMAGNSTGMTHWRAACIANTGAPCWGTACITNTGAPRWRAACIANTGAQRWRAACIASYSHPCVSEILEQIADTASLLCLCCVSAGLWSNLFSINLTQGWTSLSGSFPNWIQLLREAVRSKDEGAVAGKPAALDTFFVIPVNAVTQLLEEMLSDRPIIGQSYNFMRGLSLHRDYSQSHGFTAWKGNAGSERGGSRGSRREGLSLHRDYSQSHGFTAWKGNAGSERGGSRGSRREGLSLHRDYSQSHGFTAWKGNAGSERGGSRGSRREGLSLHRDYSQSHGFTAWKGNAGSERGGSRGSRREGLSLHRDYSQSHGFTAWKGNAGSERGGSRGSRREGLSLHRDYSQSHGFTAWKGNAGSERGGSRGSRREGLSLHRDYSQSHGFTAWKGNAGSERGGSRGSRREGLSLHQDYSQSHGLTAWKGNTGSERGGSRGSRREGLSLHRDYSQSHGFTAWKGTHLDAFPNQLTPADPQLHLADSGFSINTGTPPLLRPERGVDVLLSFNFTWGDQFKALKLTEQYCADHCLPFPRIDLSSIEGRPLQECYVFTDEGDPRAPIVLHFPLVNYSFRENSAPGVQRVGEAELSEARFKVLTPDSDYRTFDVSYTPAQHRRLVELTCYNVLNNSQALQGALRQALDRKREARHAQEVTRHHAAV
ncbi:cytosolic phospholipase A2 zeta-like [Polyodon spathula]|uniref:cytosolic phospholipase A2 zeta-like n=1 Tax=Polyodon spathula TaxID=7913 RepID=UPI001B7EB1C8|nr:cytosolic phospholipase A2 zeta-like [Polyodon spathula]